MNEIYLTKINEEQNREVIVEGDDHSVWAYVLKHSEESTRIEFDGFICSRGTLVETSKEIKDYINNAISAPLLRQYSNEFSIQREIENKNIEIDWNGNEISIKLNGIDFLIMDLEKRESYSKSTSEKGPYGIPITEKN
tara:strand:+ start:603 stop:1016 length:414 start_codon:yes stop_codon:yes gene_type:complete